MARKIIYALMFILLAVAIVELWSRTGEVYWIDISIGSTSTPPIFLLRKPFLSPPYGRQPHLSTIMVDSINEDGEEKRHKVWLCMTEKPGQLFSVGKITYGEAPPGFVERTKPAVMKPDIYYEIGVMGAVGAGSLRFKIEWDGNNHRYNVRPVR